MPRRRSLSLGLITFSFPARGIVAGRRVSAAPRDFFSEPEPTPANFHRCSVRLGLNRPCARFKGEPCDLPVLFSPFLASVSMLAARAAVGRYSGELHASSDDHWMVAPPQFGPPCSSVSKTPCDVVQLQRNRSIPSSAGSNQVMTS